MRAMVLDRKNSAESWTPSPSAPSPGEDGEASGNTPVLSRPGAGGRFRGKAGEGPGTNL